MEKLLLDYLLQGSQIMLSHIARDVTGWKCLKPSGLCLMLQET